MTSARGPSAATEKLDALQCGRAVAALMVVLYHANNFVLPRQLYDGGIAWAGFGMGYSGVEFFFVMSGFIMANVHRRDFDDPGRLGAFIWRRISRIYPIYWVVLTLLVILYQVSRNLGPDLVRDPYAILQSYLLLPSEERAILPVAWTLKHEMVFYATFCTFIVSMRAGLFVFSLWMSACVLQMLVPIDDFPASFFLSPYNLLFGFGLAVAYGYRHLPQRTATGLACLGVATFLLVGMTEQYVFAWALGWRTLGYGLGATALISALALNRRPVAAWAVFLGDASYAIYLVHLPAMNVAAVVAAKLGVQHFVPPLVMVALLSAIALAAGSALHVFVERPLLRLMQRRSIARTASVKTA